MVKLSGKVFAAVLLLFVFDAAAATTKKAMAPTTPIYRLLI